MINTYIDLCMYVYENKIKAIAHAVILDFSLPASLLLRPWFVLDGRWGILMGSCEMPVIYTMKSEALFDRV